MKRRGCLIEKNAGGLYDFFVLENGEHKIRVSNISLKKACVLMEDEMRRPEDEQKERD